MKKTKDEFTIGYDIFESVESYNHEEYYDYAKDNMGNLYKCCYGNDGDGDWYITCFEFVDTEENGETGATSFSRIERNRLTYYKKTGRLPFEYASEFSWKEVDGLTLSHREIDGNESLCFIKWDENKCFVINKWGSTK